MTRPWSTYLRSATNFIPPMQVNLRVELLRLLVPELADLRQQLDQARRLAGEAQARYRRAEDGIAEAKEALVSGANALANEARLRSGSESYAMDCLAAATKAQTELARIKADLDERHGPLLGPLAMERDQLRAELKTTEDIAASYKRVLDACPECEVHGPGCVPHAVECIEKLRGRVAELEDERAKMIEGSPMAEPRPNLATDGAPIPRAAWDALVEHTKRTL